MSCGNPIKHKIKELFDKGVELDKKILEKIEKKFNLSPYQSKCANAVLSRGWVETLIQQSQ